MLFFNDINEKIIHADTSNLDTSIICSLAGVTYPNPEYHIVRAPSDAYVFEYVISGKGYIEAKGSTTEVSAGTFYCYRRGADLNYYADANEPYEKIWMNFSGEMVARLFDFFFIDNVYTSKCTVYELFLEIHDALEHMEGRDSADVYSDILGLLFRILTVATKPRFFPSAIEMNSLDERIRTYIDSNVYNDLSLDKLSEEFGITKVHVIRVFKAKFGITPMQYLIDKKMGIAKSLLTGTVMPIKEIAILLRYSNTQHFSSSFKNVVGCTPYKFRQAKNE